jgi:hypothetical protein
MYTGDTVFVQWGIFSGNRGILEEFTILQCKKNGPPVETGALFNDCLLYEILTRLLNLYF